MSVVAFTGPPRPDPNYGIIWIYGHISVMQQSKAIKAAVHVQLCAVWILMCHSTQLSHWVLAVRNQFLCSCCLKYNSNLFCKTLWSIVITVIEEDMSLFSALCCTLLYSQLQPVKCLYIFQIALLSVVRNLVCFLCVVQLKQLGHSVDKVEFIVMGGTFMALPEEYRDYFIRNLHDALSGHTSNNVAEAVRYSAARGFSLRAPLCLMPVTRNTVKRH